MSRINLRKKRNKGISPLIATVLLIAFVIALILIIFLWGEDLVRRYAEKSGAKSEGEIACTSNIQIKVTSACKKAGTGNTKTLMKIGVKNEKDAAIDAFRVRGETSGDSEVAWVQYALDGLATKEIGVKFYEIVARDLNEATIMPVVIRKGIPTTCTQKSLHINRISDCQ